LQAVLGRHHTHRWCQRAALPGGRAVHAWPLRKAVHGRDTRAFPHRFTQIFAQGTYLLRQMVEPLAGSRGADAGLHQGTQLGTQFRHGRAMGRKLRVVRCSVGLVVGQRRCGVGVHVNFPAGLVSVRCALSRCDRGARFRVRGPVRGGARERTEAAPARSMRETPHVPYFFCPARPAPRRRRYVSRAPSRSPADRCEGPERTPSATRRTIGRCGPAHASFGSSACFWPPAMAFRSAKRRIEPPAPHVPSGCSSTRTHTRRACSSGRPAASRTTLVASWTSPARRRSERAPSGTVTRTRNRGSSSAAVICAPSGSSSR